MNNKLIQVRYLGFAIIVFMLMSGLLLRPETAYAAEEYGKISSRLIKIINLDDSGLAIGYPRRVAFDPIHQETYLLSSNGRITIYDKSYFPLGSIGVGRGAKNVIAMDIGPEGKLHISRNLYRADDIAAQSIITIYNDALLIEREIFLRDIPALTNFMVNDLAVAANGTIYLVGNMGGQDIRDKDVAVLDSAGSFKKWLGPRAMVQRKRSSEDRADNEGAFDMVENAVAIKSVYIDVVGRLYLLSAELSEVFVYDQQEKFLFQFGTKGGAKGKLSTPVALVVDYPRRLVYVADYMRHTILVYDYYSGKFVYEFGGKGFSPLWYQHPNYLEMDSKGRVIVSDLFNMRVQVVDPTNPDRPVLEPVVPAGAFSSHLPPQVIVEGEESQKVDSTVNSTIDSLSPAVVSMASTDPAVTTLTSPVASESTAGVPFTVKKISEMDSPGENVVPSSQDQSLGVGKAVSSSGDGGDLAVPVAGGEMSLAAKAGLVVAAPIVAPIALLAAGVSKL
ncbi:MAG: hypothetical protein ABFS18_01190, partial [Thermodesulfobacteriota bacterium]